MKKLFALLLSLTLLLVVGFKAEAQQTLRTFTGSHVALDTVANTGTTVWTIHNPGAKTNTSVWIKVTKIGGTVGGTITLQGSIDGVDWKALNTPNTQTALATITATDASNTYHWILVGNPLNYYRVSWTGTGTMSASATCSLLSR
jgi:hypothetical protein